MATARDTKSVKLVKDYIRLAYSLGCSVEFVPPGGISEVTLYGEFCPINMRITIFKLETEPFNARHAFTMVHEVRHLQQFLKNPVSAFWLRVLGATKRIAKAEELRYEKDADAEAVRVLTKRGIRLPAGMKGDA